MSVGMGWGGGRFRCSALDAVGIRCVGLGFLSFGRSERNTGPTGKAVLFFRVLLCHHSVTFGTINDQFGTVV